MSRYILSPHTFDAIGVFIDMENINKTSVRGDARGRRKSLPG